jgi:hypothetical protein
MAGRVVVVLCSSEEEIEQAVINWVGVKNYRRVHTSWGTNSVAHYLRVSTNEYTKASCVDVSKPSRALIVFERD